MLRNQSDHLKPAAIWAPLIIRVVLGIIFMAHGAQKLFGAFDGGGISGTAGFLGDLGLQPASFWAWVVALVEFFGGLAVFIGLLTGVAALLLVANMIVAMAAVHWSQGFFAAQGGFEFPLALAAMALSLVFSGPGV
ncbi:MAG TPA: DoxX family protein, partial [Armatimonadota bacterium]|nr:DoxX family protein [Armatimonadota bacterium]